MNTYNKCNCGCLQSNKDNLYNNIDSINELKEENVINICLSNIENIF